MTYPKCNLRLVNENGTKTNCNCRGKENGNCYFNGECIDQKKIQHKKDK